LQYLLVVQMVNNLSEKLVAYVLKLQALSKHWYPPTKLHSVITLNNIIYIFSTVDFRSHPVTSLKDQL
jgi:hypothetical protein